MYALHMSIYIYTYIKLCVNFWGMTPWQPTKPKPGPDQVAPGYIAAIPGCQKHCWL